MAGKRLTEKQRKEVFEALVLAQDGGLSPAASKTQVAQQFGLDEEFVEKVEREGLEKDWPPL